MSGYDGQPPLTPAMCEKELHRLASKLEERTDALVKLLPEAAAKDYEYRQNYAQAVLDVASGDLEAPSLKPTVAEKEAVAVRHVAGEMKARLVSAAEAEAAKEVVRSLRDQLSALQSVNANARSQAGLSG